MRKYILIILVFLVLMSSGCLFKGNEDFIHNQGIENRNSDKHYIWNFGKIKQDKIVSHVFKIINDTAKTLNINRTDTSCGCTVSSIDKNSLLPGESTGIEVRFNPRGYNGPVEQFIYVNTDRLDNPIIKLIIKARVEK